MWPSADWKIPPTPGRKAPTAPGQNHGLFREPESRGKMKKAIGIFLLLIAGVAVNGQSLKGGAALRKITPDPLLPVSGGK